MNEAYLTAEEAARLHHWRTAHRSQGKSKLNEDCPICVEGKKKIGTYKRNFEFMGHTKGPVRRINASSVTVMYTATYVC